MRSEEAMPKNKANNTDTRREDWATPQWLFDKLNEVFDFWIDLAASKENSKCERFITEDDDFLSMDGFSHLDDRWAWCNPPYGRTGCGKWVSKIFEVPSSVSLLPASVGAKWFQQIWGQAYAICFMNERLRFIGAPSTAQFDSCLVVKSEVGVPFGGLHILRSLGNLVTTDGIHVKTPCERVTYF